MTANKFFSVFSDELNDYLNSKIAAGFKKDSYIYDLRCFDKFCIDNGIENPTFTRKDAANWIIKRDVENHAKHYKRVNAIKHFLTYLSLKKYDVFVTRDIKFKNTSFVPYIFSPDECDRYFYEVDNFDETKNRKSIIQYPVLFRIMYCCGTRINETLGIRKKDVDLDNGIIVLNEAKNQCQRVIVVGEDLRLLLKSYADKCFYALKDDEYIFSKTDGSRLSRDSVYNHHRAILKRANISYLGNCHGPRLHDLRHHMAVYSFKQMIDSGLDMYVALPILSTYLGHKTIFATERYIRLTMELFPYIEEKFTDKVNKIFGGNLDEEH